MSSDSGRPGAAVSTVKCQPAWENDSTGVGVENGNSRSSDGRDCRDDRTRNAEISDSSAFAWDGEALAITPAAELLEPKIRITALVPVGPIERYWLGSSRCMPRGGEASERRQPAVLFASGIGSVLAGYDYEFGNKRSQQPETAEIKLHQPGPARP